MLIFSDADNYSVAKPRFKLHSGYHTIVLFALKSKSKCKMKSPPHTDLLLHL